MSGGSLDYAYSKVENIAYDVAQKADSNLHKAFAKHLYIVAEALHDFEWVLSGDCGYGDEVEAIRKVVSPSQEIETAKESAKKLIEELQVLIDSKEK